MSLLLALIVTLMFSLSLPFFNIAAVTFVDVFISVQFKVVMCSSCLILGSEVIKLSPFLKTLDSREQVSALG